jgi:hypothetical protein
MTSSTLALTDRGLDNLLSSPRNAPENFQNPNYLRDREIASRQPPDGVDATREPTLPAAGNGIAQTLLSPDGDRKTGPNDHGAAAWAEVTE